MNVSVSRVMMLRTKSPLPKCVPILPSLHVLAGPTTLLGTSTTALENDRSTLNASSTAWTSTIKIEPSEAGPS